MAHSYNRQINASNCELVKKNSLAWYSRGILGMEIYLYRSTTDSGNCAIMDYNGGSNLFKFDIDEFSNLCNPPPEFSALKNNYNPGSDANPNRLGFSG